MLWMLAQNLKFKCYEGLAPATEFGICRYVYVVIMATIWLHFP
jgi:hypothetical protein